MAEYDTKITSVSLMATQLKPMQYFKIVDS